MCQLSPPLMMTNTPRDVATPKTTTPLKFPAKLYLILSTPEFHDIICWLPHGRSWRVLQVEGLEKEVLPAFFRHGRYASFIRQVNGWGFRRIPCGPDLNSYYHESFSRDSPESCRRMRRPTAQELTDRKKEDRDSPPNFYLSPPLLKSPNRKQEGENAILPAPQNAPLDFKRNLISRLSICSLEEMEMILNLELGKLEEQKKSTLKQLLASLGGTSLNTESSSPDARSHVRQPQPVPYKVPSFPLQSPSMDASMMTLSVLRAMFLL